MVPDRQWGAAAGSSAGRHGDSGGAADSDLAEMGDSIHGGRRLISLTDEVRLMFAGVVTSDQELRAQPERVGASCAPRPRAAST